MVTVGFWAVAVIDEQITTIAIATAVAARRANGRLTLDEYVSPDTGELFAPRRRIRAALELIDSIGRAAPVDCTGQQNCVRSGRNVW